MKHESWSLGQPLPGAVEKAGVVWSVLSFDELAPDVLYRLLSLRSSALVVEQDCAYQDIDGLDLQGLHLVGMRRLDDSTFDVIATARILPPGCVFAEPTMGRLCVAAPYRQNGIGRMLLSESVQVCQARYPGQAIRVSAQAHLEKFYQGSGFQTVSEVYLQDRIPHVEMLLAAA